MGLRFALSSVLVLLGACSSLKSASPESEPPADGGGENGSDGGATTEPTPEGDVAPRATNGDPRWPQWPTPVDTPTADNFTIENSADGPLITDMTTGLTWADHPSAGLSWEDASAYCDELSYGNKDDWRLPTRIEIISITSFSPDPGEQTIQIGAQVVFSPPPSDAAGSCFWSASEYVYSKDHWRASSIHIGDLGYAKDCLARCVRGGPALGAPKSPGFAREGQNLVFDARTGLFWERLPAESANAKWAVADARCKKLTLDGHAMRLPTVKELATIVDETRKYPAMTTDFVGGGAEVHTSISHVNIDFERGDVLSHFGESSASSRCVSGP